MAGGHAFGRPRHRGRSDCAGPTVFLRSLLALTGMLGIVITGDVFNLYVSRISSLASYALIGMGSSRRALRRRR
jgi:formate hydrogenlyase subunit 3/multisubunit Na+/H+ antiporter MnhD subunit